MLSRCFLDFSVDVGGFCNRTESDVFLLLLLFYPERKTISQIVENQ